VNPLDDIAGKIADNECQDLCKRAVRILRARKDFSASREGTFFLSKWDEFRAAVQSDDSFDWKHYMETITGAIENRIVLLPDHVFTAIWLQTEKGLEWSSENHDGNIPPTNTHDIIEYLFANYIVRAAEESSRRKRRIRREKQGQ